MVRGIPTVILFKGGEIVEQIVGLADQAEFQKKLDKYL
jgi:thioredoxin-like negative regulator of GroEL